MISICVTLLVVIVTMNSLQTRLGDCIEAWERIGASKTICSWVKDGVPINFKSVPNNTRLFNPPFSKVHRNFIKSELTRLLLAGAIEKCEHLPKFISPLNVVPKKNNKFRLITNLKMLNGFVDLCTFKNEDIRTSMNLVATGDEMVTVDLQDCFFHFRVHEKVRDFLAFSFEGQLYRWAVLPFGLCLSPYYCCKIIRPVVAYLRTAGDLKCQVYVDDWIIFAQPNLIKEQSDLLLQVLKDLGWLVNFGKSDLLPASEKPYIGFMINSTGQSGVPELWVTPSRLLLSVSCVRLKDSLDRQVRIYHRCT
jgi:hypothetical protein